MLRLEEAFTIHTKWPSPANWWNHYKVAGRTLNADLAQNSINTKPHSLIKGVGFSVHVFRFYEVSFLHFSPKPSKDQFRVQGSEFSVKINNLTPGLGF